MTEALLAGWRSERWQPPAAPSSGPPPARGSSLRAPAASSSSGSAAQPMSGLCEEASEPDSPPSCSSSPSCSPASCCRCASCACWWLCWCRSPPGLPPPRATASAAAAAAVAAASPPPAEQRSRRARGPSPSCRERCCCSPCMPSMSLVVYARSKPPAQLHQLRPGARGPESRPRETRPLLLPPSSRAPNQRRPRRARAALLSIFRYLVTAVARCADTLLSSSSVRPPTINIKGRLRFAKVRTRFSSPFLRKLVHTRARTPALVFFFPVPVQSQSSHRVTLAAEGPL